MPEKASGNLGSICVTFRPGISIPRRWLLEQRLTRTVEAKGYGIVDGGGGFDDGSESNIFLEEVDLEKALPIVREALRRGRAPKNTVLEIEGSDEGDDPIEQALYDSSLRPFCWWKLW